MRSTFLASFALAMTLVFSGCEDTTKTTPPATPTATTPTTPATPEAEKGKMEPTTTPPVEKPAETPK